MTIPSRSGYGHPAVPSRFESYTSRDAERLCLGAQGRGQRRHKNTESFLWGPASFREAKKNNKLPLVFQNETISGKQTPTHNHPQGPTKVPGHERGR